MGAFNFFLNSTMYHIEKCNIARHKRESKIIKPGVKNVSYKHLLKQSNLGR